MVSKFHPTDCLLNTEDIRYLYSEGTGRYHPDQTIKLSIPNNKLVLDILCDTVLSIKHHPYGLLAQMSNLTVKMQSDKQIVKHSIE